MGNSITKSGQTVTLEPPPSYDSVFGHVTAIKPDRATTIIKASSITKLWRPDDLIVYRRVSSNEIVTVPLDFDLVPLADLPAFLQAVTKTQVLPRVIDGKIKLTSLNDNLVDNIARYALITASNPLSQTIPRRIHNRYFRDKIIAYVLLSRDVSRIKKVCYRNDQAAALVDVLITRQAWLQQYQVVEVVKAWLSDWTLVELFLTTTLFQAGSWSHFPDVMALLKLLDRPDTVDQVITSLIVTNVKLLHSLDYRQVRKVQPDWAPDLALRLLIQVAFQNLIIKTASVQAAIKSVGLYDRLIGSGSLVTGLLSLVLQFQIPLDQATLRCCFNNDWLLWLVQQGYLTTSQITWLEECLANESNPDISQRLKQAIAWSQTKSLVG